MQRRTVAIAATGFGFVLWLGSMGIRHREPWDISFTGYCLALALAGGACAALATPWSKKDVLIWPAWIVVGQMLYGLFRPDQWSLWPLSLFAFVLLGITSVIGAALALALRRR